MDQMNAIAQLLQQQEASREHVNRGLPNFHALAFSSRADAEAQKELLEQMKKVRSRVKAGDLSDLENMLVDQAMLLNYLSADYAALSSASRMPNTKEQLFGMALKAQNACRKTISTLNEMKNPKRSATFIKNQQNNLISGDTANGTTQVDTGAARIAATKNPTVEAVAVEQRPKNARRKGKKQPKRTTARAEVG